MLHGSPNRVVVYTDHRNLEYFPTTKILNRRQARWVEILSEFNFVITYCSGEKNGKVDALSRRTDPVLEGGSDNPIFMFKPGQLAAVERTNQLLVQILGQNGKVPTRSTEYAAGYALYSAEEITLKAKTRQAISTEIAILVPSGTHAVAVLEIHALISSFLLSHICTYFGLCNSLGGHICGDSYDG